MTRQIKDYEGIYFIDTYGVITTAKGKVRKTYNKVKNHTTYIQVVLSKNNTRRTKLVHRLVAEAFLPNPESKPHINHIDNNGSNNHVTNLEWCTHKENMLHSMKQGRLEAGLAKARTSAAVLNKNTAKIAWNARIGCTFNNIKILSIISLGKHPKGLTECTKCNTTKVRTLGNVVNGSVLMCRSCSTIQKHKDRKLKHENDKTYMC